MTPSIWVRLGLQDLLAKIGRCIDHRDGAAGRADLFHKHRTSPAPILGVVWVAGAPVVADAGNARGGAAAKDRDTERHAAPPTGSAAFAAAFALSNSLKKFAVVMSAIPASLTPLRSAEHFCGVADISRLVAFAAMRVRRKKWRVRFDKQPVEGQGGGEIAQFARLREGEDAGERDIKPKLNRGLGQFAPARIAM